MSKAIYSDRLARHPDKVPKNEKNPLNIVIQTYNKPSSQNTQRAPLKKLMHKLFKKLSKINETTAKLEGMGKSGFIEKMVNSKVVSPVRKVDKKRVRQHAFAKRRKKKLTRHKLLMKVKPETSAHSQKAKKTSAHSAKKAKKTSAHSKKARQEDVRSF
jgi:hypothetical protein